MRKLDEKEEKELNAMGVFFLEGKKVADLDKRMLVCAVEVAFPKETVLEVNNFTMKVVNKRGTEVYLCDFQIRDADDGKKLLSFAVCQELPKFVKLVEPPQQVATSFIDLCWFSGHEALNEDMIPDATTPVRADAVVGDLGWCLPTRYVDVALVYTLGVANTTIFSGVLEDAIIYGYAVHEGKQ